MKVKNLGNQQKKNMKDLIKQNNKNDSECEKQRKSKKNIEPQFSSYLENVLKYFY